MRLSGVLPFAENLWLETYPLKRLGVDLRRNVAIIRLTDGSLVIHSTAPFTHAQVAQIQTLGQPRWILDAMLDHDTYSRNGRQAFPDATFLGPPGFAERAGIAVESLSTPPPAWGRELQVVEIEGMPDFREHVVFHAPSRTLIVADLIFNFPIDSIATKTLMGIALKGGRQPGVSRRFHAAIKDRDAFRGSLCRVMEWPFDRVIVGHGTPMERGAKELVRELFRRVGWL